jgi:hypothetical protein
MGVAQFISAVAWCSVIAAPWAALLLGEPLRSPYVVAAVSTGVLIGTLAGMHHQGQVAALHRHTLAAVERELARAAERAREEATAAPRSNRGNGEQG